MRARARCEKNGEERRRRARLEMFYKFHYGLVSINSSYLPKPSGSRLSSRRKNNTCSCDIPSRCMTLYRQMSSFPRTVPDWNSLHQKVVTAESLDCFKSRAQLVPVTPPPPPPSSHTLPYPPPHSPFLCPRSLNIPQK